MCFGFAKALKTQQKSSNMKTSRTSQCRAAIVAFCSFQKVYSFGRGILKMEARHLWRGGAGHVQIASGQEMCPLTSLLFLLHVFETALT